MVLPVGLNVIGVPSSSTEDRYGMSRIANSNMHSMQRVHGIHVGQVQTQFPYVDFVIINVSQRYMVRCNRKAILENSEELTRIIQATAPPQTVGTTRRCTEYNHFQITNVDPTDFEELTRFLETKFIRFRGINHIIRIMQLADRFSCPALYKHCIVELDLLISSETVLEIYRAMNHFRNMLDEEQLYDSSKNLNLNENKNTKTDKTRKPPFKSKKNVLKKLQTPITIENYGAALLNNALEFIDMHAEFILTDRQMNNLAFQEFAMVLKRATLQVSSEVVVYNCLADWSVAECLRREIVPSPENRRQVLGPLSYAPHYLLMTVAEFETSCCRVELLDQTEIQLVRDALQGKVNKNLSNEQLELLNRFRTPRPKFAQMPVHISDRSDPRNYPRLMRRAENTDESCLSKCGFNCLSAFICIFD